MSLPLCPLLRYSCIIRPRAAAIRMYSLHYPKVEPFRVCTVLADSMINFTAIISFDFLINQHF